MAPGDSGARWLGAAAMEWLRGLGTVTIAPALTAAELDAVESAFRIEFADDHRVFLEEGLPISAGTSDDNPWSATTFGFPDWRNGDRELLRSQVELPVRAVLQDVDAGRWPPAWGPRPERAQDALSTAHRRLAQVPRLAPVYAHRYLPSGHGTWARPVLSVWGLDVVCYGSDLLDYLKHEFAADEWEAGDHGPERVPATVEFWTDGA